MMAAFTDLVEATTVEAGAIALFWLEQNHFVVKTAASEVIHIDPYLTRAKPEIFIHPEAVVTPDEARGDLVFLTHDHGDHTNPETVAAMAANNPQCAFVGTPEARERCLSNGIDDARVSVIDAGQTLEVGSFKVTATPAVSTGDNDATTHIGFVFDFDGVTAYFVGDTRKEPWTYGELFEPLRGMKPDVMIVPINEGYNNPGPEGARWLVDLVEPKLIVPCHFDCFKHNTIDPALFVEALSEARKGDVRQIARGTEPLNVK